MGPPKRVSKQRFTLQSLLTNTLSQQDGIQAKREAQWRKRYCILIQKAGQDLQMGPDAISTATYYCHHYFAVKSMARNGPFVVASAALYLAGKVEEHPKSLTTVTERMFSLVHRKKSKVLEMLNHREFVQKLKDKVLTAERVLLYTLGADFDVSSVNKLILEIFTATHKNTLPDSVLANHAALQQVMQMCWNVGNDSVRTQLRLQYGALQIAVGCIHVALLLLKIEPRMQNSWNWWEHLQVSADDLRDITSQLLDTYDKEAGQQEPHVPQVAAFRLHPARGGRANPQVAVAINMVAAPGSDPHSDLSEQTLAQSPAGFVGLKLGSHATPAATHKPGS